MVVYERPMVVAGMLNSEIEESTESFEASQVIQELLRTRFESALEELGRDLPFGVNRPFGVIVEAAPGL